MSSSSSGSSSSSSYSTPTVIRTPENDILDQIAQYAQSLAQQMQGWATSTYAQTSNITNQAVNNFLDVSQKMTGFAGGMIDQYNNLFAPENRQLIQDANTYASPERMKLNMGMAGATATQAGNQAIKNSEQNLLSYGIDPSSGRYAALDKAAAVQNAANAAGAMNMQRNADINTGQQLRAEAIQAGSLLPAAISNAQNTAIQANAGASNASLANANTGANLMSLANKYLQTAMSLKLSPTGQNSQSHGSSSQQSSGDGGGGSRGGGGGGYGGGGGPGLNDGGGTAWGMDMPTGGYADYGSGDGSGYNGMGSDYTGRGGWGDYGSSSGASYDPYGAGEFGSTFGQDFGGNTATGSGWGNIQGYDTSGLDTGWGSVDTSSPATYGGTDDSYGSGFGDFGSSYDPSANSFDGDWGYAQGGYVPPSMSPSGGARVDDVNARLNAGEFVIPQDVSAWKGQEFFHNLIAKSRALRNQAQAQTPVGPSVTPPQQPTGAQ